MNSRQHLRQVRKQLQAENALRSAGYGALLDKLHNGDPMSLEDFRPSEEAQERQRKQHEAFLRKLEEIAESA